MSNWDNAKRVIWVTSPINGLAVDLMQKAYESVKAAYAKNDTKELKDVIEKQAIQEPFNLQQAKLDQEFAIAERIRNAEVVSIEEFYDVSGEGKAGLKANEDGAFVGLGASGKYITKRIYQFKGKLGVLSAEKNEELTIIQEK